MVTICPKCSAKLDENQTWTIIDDPTPLEKQKGLRARFVKVCQDCYFRHKNMKLDFTTITDPEGVILYADVEFKMTKIGTKRGLRGKSKGPAI